jgi:hypothetical protein
MMANSQEDIASAREKRRQRIKAHTVGEGSQGSERIADPEQLRAQKPLEYGVMLTAVGGLAVRFADEGFHFVEDYALRLDDVEAVFAPTDSSKEHIRILFQPVGGALALPGPPSEVRLDLEVSEGSLMWKVSGLPTNNRLVSSFEAASEILLKLTDFSHHVVKHAS